MNLFIGNLNPETTITNLRALFQEYGEIITAKIIYDNATGMSRGFGFIEYGDKFHAFDAIDNIDCTFFEGNVISVKEAKQSNSKASGGNKSFKSRGPRPGGGFNSNRPAGGGGYNSSRPGGSSPRPGGYNPRPGGYTPNPRPDSNNANRSDNYSAPRRETYTPNPRPNTYTPTPRPEINHNKLDDDLAL